MNKLAADDKGTVMLWQKNISNANSSSFWALAASVGRGWQFHIPWSDGTIYFDTTGCCGTDTRLSKQPKSNHDFKAWRHYAFVKNGGYKAIYIDGVLLTEADGYAPLPKDFKKLIIGASDELASPDGIIDDFAIFKGALTEREILEIAKGAPIVRPKADTDHTTQTFTVTVTKASQSTTFAPIPSKAYGDAPFVLAATSTSGLPVTFSVFSGPAKIAGNTVTLTGAGAVTLRALQAGDANYAAAPEVDQTFTVAKAALAVKANDVKRAFGAANPAFTSAFTGFVSGDNASSISGVAELSTSATSASPPGTYTITAHPGNLASPDYDFAFVNGTLTVTKADQTISFAQLPNQTYGAAPVNLSATTSSGLPATFSLVSGPALLNGASVSFTGAGTVTIRASQVGDGNYNPAAEVVRSFDVGKTTLTVRANDATRAYGTANPTFTSSLSGFVNGDTVASVSGTPDFTTAATASSDAGNYPITPTLNTLAAANYSFAFANGTLTVTTANAELTLANLNQTYDGTGRAVAATTSPVGLSGVTITYADSPTPPVNAGSYDVVALLINANYAAPNASGTLVVAKANQAIAFTAIGDKKMGVPAFMLEATATSGLPVTFNLVSGPATLAALILSVTGAGNVTVRASQAGNSNYNPAADADQTFAVLSVVVPSLQVSLSTKEIVFTWPAAAAGFVLESTTTLSTTDWTPVPSAPMVVGDQNVVINPVTGFARFYRLRKP